MNLQLYLMLPNCKQQHCKALAAYCTFTVGFFFLLRNLKSYQLMNLLFVAVKSELTILALQE